MIITNLILYKGIIIKLCTMLQHLYIGEVSKERVSSACSLFQSLPAVCMRACNDAGARAQAHVCKPCVLVLQCVLTLPVAGVPSSMRHGQRVSTTRAHSAGGLRAGALAPAAPGASLS